jgi:tungstate transport system substrate-binding protein
MKINSGTKWSARKMSIIGLSLVLIMIALMVLTGCSSQTPTPTTAPKTTAPTTSAAPVTTTATAPTTTSPVTPTTAKPSTTTAPSTTALPSTSASPSPTTRVSNSKELLIASTTSTRDSGLMDAHTTTNFPNWPWDGLIPLFEKQYPFTVKAVYVGSGAAMSTGQLGNADLLLVHAPDSEVKFVADGYGINRTLIMHNDYVIIGPANDPAGINGQKSVIDALKKIADTKSTFYSRGDNSGTDQLDKIIWAAAGVTVKDGAATNPSWYIEGNTGMGALLLIADQKSGYIMSDRATYLANTDKIKSKIVVQGDPLLLNIYHAIEVNPAKFPGIINDAAAKAFIAFMVSPSTQALIGKYGADKYGAPLFYPDAGKTEAELGSK